MDVILKDLNLLKKYDIYAFDYTDYPHKKFWSFDVGDAEYRKTLVKQYTENPDNPVLLYFHIPFCDELCYFCICSREKMKKYDHVVRYLHEVLFREIDLMVEFLKENNIKLNVEEIFMGGGSPTIIQEKEFDEFIERIKPIVDVKNLKQFCVEVDPRRVDLDRLRFYHSRHVNKISIGIQDFDPEVQQEVNRIQPPELVERIMVPEIRGYFPSINFDVIVGLPKQTRKSIHETMQHIFRMKPDRVSLTYMYYGTAHRSNMLRLMRNAPLPDFYERKAIFVEALNMLIEAGYVRTGFEHFAKPGDPVEQALQKKQAFYTSLGAVTGRCLDVVAMGSSAHGNIGYNNFQNFYEISKCRESLDKGEFPIYRGIAFSQDDIIRNRLIRVLRTYLRTDFADYKEKFGIDFKEYFAKELKNLDEFVKDGLVVLTDHSLEMTETGAHFGSLIASVFDRYLDGPWYRDDIETRPTHA